MGSLTAGSDLDRESGQMTDPQGFKDARPLDPPLPGRPVDSLYAIYDRTPRDAWHWETGFEDDQESKP